MRKRIACFFTAGFTELNAMKRFMEKINADAVYIQLCPTAERRSKDDIRNRHAESIRTHQNGLTGKALIDFIIDFVGKNRFQEEKYDGILIEDDKDDRFLLKKEDGSAVLDTEKWECFKKEIVDKISKKCPGIPIVFFYASPEVEAWFLADFDHSFGSVYRGELTHRENDFFKVKFQQYVRKNILTSRYADHVEEYGYFDGEYRKLSEEIQRALDENDFMTECSGGAEHPTLRYSKRRHGESMLEQIDPTVVLRHCSTYFREGYYGLQKI